MSTGLGCISSEQSGKEIFSWLGVRRKEAVTQLPGIHTWHLFSLQVSHDETQWGNDRSQEVKKRKPCKAYIQFYLYK